MISTLIKFYPKSVQTLSEISLDTDKKPYESLCIDELKFLSFDTIVKEYFPKKQPASFDLLAVYKNNIFCIEFKNSRPRDIKNRNVQNKAIEGIASLYKISQLFSTINLNEYKLYYIVLYKPLNIQNTTKSQNFLHNRARQKEIEFGLEKYHKTFYDYILTKPCKDYKYIKNKLSIKEKI